MLQESKSIVFEALTCWPMRMPTLSASRLPRGRLHVPWQMSLPDDAGFWFIICFLNHVFIMFFICFYHVFESLSCFYQPRLDFIHVYSDYLLNKVALNSPAICCAATAPTEAAILRHPTPSSKNPQSQTTPTSSMSTPCLHPGTIRNSKETARLVQRDPGETNEKERYP